MKKVITCLLAVLGLSSACSRGHKYYEDADVNGFAELMADTDVFVLDARTAEEFNSGHIERATCIDVKKADFLKKAKSVLPADKTIAVYCRGGRRSAKACTWLSATGYKCVNLEGGITAWIAAGKPVTKE